jgi:hypothetical protein
MAKKTSPEGKDHKVSEAIKVELHDGRFVDATIRAVVHQVDDAQSIID